MNKMGALLFPLLILSGDLVGGEVKKVTEKSFEMQKGGLIRVVSNDGKVSVQGWDREEVRLIITKKIWLPDRQEAENLLERLNVEVDQSSNYLHIEEVDSYRRNYVLGNLFRTDRWGHSAQYRIDYDLKVPNRINLEIEADEGNVEISGLSGSIELNIDEGNLFLKQVTAIDLKINGDEGQLEFEEVGDQHSRLNANVDEGGFQFSNCQFGSVTLNSDEGNIILGGVTLGSCDVKSDEGSIEARMLVFKPGQFRFATDEGNVFLGLRNAEDIELDLRSEEGRIETNLPFKIIRRNDESERLSGVLGNPDVYLNVFSQEGNIIVKEFR